MTTTNHHERTASSPVLFTFQLIVTVLFGRLAHSTFTASFADDERVTGLSDLAPDLRVRVLISYVALPFVLVGVLLFAMNRATQPMPECLYILAFCVGFVWVVNATLGEASGLASGLAFVVVAGLLSLANYPPQYFNTSFGITIGFAGASGCTIAALKPGHPRFLKSKSRLQRIAFYTLNGAASGLIFATCIALMGLLRNEKPSIYVPVSWPASVPNAVICMIPSALTVWLNRRESIAVGYSLRLLVLLVIVPLLLVLAPMALGEAIGPVIYGLMGACLYGSAFTLPKSLGAKAGANSAVMGAFGGMSIFVLQACIDIVYLNHTDWMRAFAGGMGIILGLTRVYWQPVLIYPVEVAWNTFLYVLELTALPRFQLPCWLVLHSALWDSYQFLPMPLLRLHLTHVLSTHQPALLRVARLFDSNVAQHALRKSKIDLDLKVLADCSNVRDIGNAHEFLHAATYSGHVAAAIRSYADISMAIASAMSQMNLQNRKMLLRSVEGELDELLRLTGMREMGAQERLTSINNVWHEVVHSEIEHLSRQMQQRGEIRNPYVVGVPLTNVQEVFIVRSDVVERVDHLLTDIHRPPLLLFGQRRMGKTSLLRNLDRLLPPSIVPVVFDCEGIASANTFGELLYAISRAMTHACNVRQLPVQLPVRARLMETPFVAFNDWLDDVESLLMKHGFDLALLALDEFAALLAVEEQRYSVNDFMGLLRHTIQHRKQIKVLLAGSQPLDELHDWAKYLVNVQVVKLGNLSPQDARQLIEHPTRDFLLRYQPGAARRAYEITSGHPALTQLLCYEIVALKNEQPLSRRTQVSVADVNRALGRAIESGQFFFADIERNQLNPAGRELLYALAHLGEGVTFSRDDISRLFPDSDPDALLSIPLRRDLLVFERNRYRFAVEMVRVWFDQAHLRQS